MPDDRLLQTDIKNTVCMLTTELDADFINNGFKRRKNGLIYTRKIRTTVQKIEIVFYSHPSYHDSVLAHIYPWMSVYFPEINSTAENLVDIGYLSGWLKKFTLRQPIQIFSSTQSWYLADNNDYERLKTEISSFLIEYTFPLLGLLKGGDNYLSLYEETDSRLIWDDQQYICVASAYINRQEYDKAYQVIEKRFGKPGLRKIYRKAFEYFQDKL